MLYDRDSSAAYRNLQELEALSDREDVLYPHLGEFLEMLGSAQYVVRVRGFRLLCRQARWDRENRIDAHMDTVLAALGDEKPTAVRQALAALELLAPHKPQLHGAIRDAVGAMDAGRYRDTMAPLIWKDMQRLLGRIAGTEG